MEPLFWGRPDRRPLAGGWAILPAGTFTGCADAASVHLDQVRQWPLCSAEIPWRAFHSARKRVQYPSTVYGCRLMSHTTREKSKLLARVRRIRGQVEALERALEAEEGCAEVLQQIAAVRGAISGLMVEVMEDHIETHLADSESDAQRRQGANELIEVVRAYLR